jgi:hypothetical protein
MSIDYFLVKPGLMVGVDRPCWFVFAFEHAELGSELLLWALSRRSGLRQANDSFRSERTFATAGLSVLVWSTAAGHRNHYERPLCKPAPPQISR